MKQATFFSLTPKQRHVLLLAIQIRNAMEGFHMDYLSDEQMATLNPIIRQALFDVVTDIEDTEHPNHGQRMDYLISLIPDYWEVPTETTREMKRTLDKR